MFMITKIIERVYFQQKYVKYGGLIHSQIQDSVQIVKKQLNLASTKAGVWRMF